MKRVSLWWLAGLGVILLLAGVVSRFASDQPDGLERVAEDQGFSHYASSGHGILEYGGGSALIGLGVVLILVTVLTAMVRRGR